MLSAPSLAQHPLRSTPEGCEGGRRSVPSHRRRGRRREHLEITNVQEIFDWQVTDWSRRIVLTNGLLLNQTVRWLEDFLTGTIKNDPWLGRFARARDLAGFRIA